MYVDMINLLKQVFDVCLSTYDMTLEKKYNLELVLCIIWPQKSFLREYLHTSCALEYYLAEQILSRNMINKIDNEDKTIGFIQTRHAL
jgi:hypothetical protein